MLHRLHEDRYANSMGAGSSFVVESAASASPVRKEPFVVHVFRNMEMGVLFYIQFNVRATSPRGLVNIASILELPLWGFDIAQV